LRTCLEHSFILEMELRRREESDCGEEEEEEEETLKMRNRKIPAKRGEDAS